MYAKSILYRPLDTVYIHNYSKAETVGLLLFIFDYKCDTEPNGVKY